MPLNDLPRASGVLMHPTSLTGRHGIGDLGAAAYAFIDFLARSEQALWQVLPLNPVCYDDYSPYRTSSSAAGNPLLISLESLAGDGLLVPQQLADLPPLPYGRVDYDGVVARKEPLLRQAFDAFKAHGGHLTGAYESFRAENAPWLEDYALFTALRAAYKGMPWNLWPSEVRRRDRAALTAATRRLSDEMAYQEFLQFTFFRQWNSLKAYANAHGISIVGDVPIYVAHDNVDVWVHPDYFQLQPQTLEPAFQGGCAPDDFFTREGQAWGSPVYNWDVLKRDGYRWWLDRFASLFQHFDWVRLDHFRGFEAYWVIPPDAHSAAEGHFITGPGAAFFETVERTFGVPPIIVEDLGYITPEVLALREQFAFPGMFVLQFAFRPVEDNPYLPYKCGHNSVMYTTTHDTDTTAGWFESLPALDRGRVLTYIGEVDPEGIHWSFIRLALGSVARWAILPLQDVLGLGSEGRMNLPGSLGATNWSWRVAPDALSDEVGARLQLLTRTYGRAVRGLLFD
jgi:4-alpha-glucanotransferase